MEERIEAIFAGDGCVELTPRETIFDRYGPCFSGEEAVDVLCMREGIGRDEATMVLAGALRRGQICHVSNYRDFIDSPKMLYYHTRSMPAGQEMRPRRIIKEGMLIQKKWFGLLSRECFCTLSIDPPLFRTHHKETLVIESEVDFKCVCHITAQLGKDGVSMFGITTFGEDRWFIAPSVKVAEKWVRALERVLSIATSPVSDNTCPVLPKARHFHSTLKSDGTRDNVRDEEDDERAMAGAHGEDDDEDEGSTSDDTEAEDDDDDDEWDSEVDDEGDSDAVEDDSTRKNSNAERTAEEDGEGKDRVVAAPLNATMKKRQRKRKKKAKSKNEKKSKKPEDKDDEVADRMVSVVRKVTKTAMQSVAMSGMLRVRSVTMVYWVKRYFVLLKAPYKELRCFLPLRTDLAEEVMDIKCVEELYRHEGFPREFFIRSDEGVSWMVRAKSAKSADAWFKAIRDVIRFDWGLKTMLSRVRIPKHSTSKKWMSAEKAALAFTRAANDDSPLTEAEVLEDAVRETIVPELSRGVSSVSSIVRGVRWEL